MLYAASVKVSIGKKICRRIDLVVTADNLEQASEKALKQARHLYTPSKKATYAIMQIINETEALTDFSPVNLNLPQETEE